MRAAVDALDARYGTLPLVVGGFSFGAVFSIGYPVSVTPLPGELHKPVLFVQGERDAFGSADGLEASAGGHAVVVIPEADHFFEGKLDALEETLGRWLDRRPWES